MLEKDDIWQDPRCKPTDPSEYPSYFGDAIRDLRTIGMHELRAGRIHWKDGSASPVTISQLAELIKQEAIEVTNIRIYNPSGEKPSLFIYYREPGVDEDEQSYMVMEYADFSKIIVAATHDEKVNGLLMRIRLSPYIDAFNDARAIYEKDSKEATLALKEALGVSSETTPGT